MALLLGSTWLAVHVLVAEHGSLLATAAACGVAPAGALLHRTAT